MREQTGEGQRESIPKRSRPAEKRVENENECAIEEGEDDQAAEDGRGRGLRLFLAWFGQISLSNFRQPEGQQAVNPPVQGNRRAHDRDGRASHGLAEKVSFRVQA